MLKSVWCLEVIFLFCVQEVGGFGGSLHFSLPKEGEVKSFLLPQNDCVQFLTFSSNTYCGVFCWFVFTSNQEHRMWYEGRNFGSANTELSWLGSGELHLSLFPSLPLLVGASTSLFHHHLMLHCRELILEVFFSLLAEISCSATCHLC